MKTKIIKSPEMGLKRLEALQKKMKGQKGIKVGLPRGSNAYPDGTSVIMVGTVHEFGSPLMNVPARSYLRSTVVENKEAYRKIVRQLMEGMVKGQVSRVRAMQILGQVVEADVKQKIFDIKEPALKHPRSEKGRVSVGDGEDNPLVDTSHLMESITFVNENV